MTNITNVRGYSSVTMNLWDWWALWV
jgi:hypothetical protein